MLGENRNPPERLQARCALGACTGTDTFTGTGTDRATGVGGGSGIATSSGGALMAIAGGRSFQRSRRLRTQVTVARAAATRWARRFSAAARAASATADAASATTPNGPQIAPDQIREDRRLALLAGLLGCRPADAESGSATPGARTPARRGDSVRKLELRDGQGGDVRPGLVAQAREQLALFRLGQQHRQEHQVRRTAVEGGERVRARRRRQQLVVVKLASQAGERRLLPLFGVYRKNRAPSGTCCLY